MDKKEYIIRQLGRTKGKKYEAYVVHRIIHLLNDFDLKFVTQQYVHRPNGRALTDLFFPQLGLHIEVDEDHHFTPENAENDKIRQADIVNATGHEFIRINMQESLCDINDAIDALVSRIRHLKETVDFLPWNLEGEYKSQTYIDRGYIDIQNDVAFLTIKDACNCFGHAYAGYQQAGASHPDKDIMLWFPKLFKNGKWDNKILDEDNTIVERHEDELKAIEHVTSHLNNKVKHKHKRIVFAKVKGNLGDTLYRFRGQYELDVSNSNPQKGLVWRRTLNRVCTFNPQ
ncbi:AbaSI family restriction endonuclease [Colwelliaceae bacterium BS250]